MPANVAPGNRVRELFFEAVEVPALSRDAFLDSRCEGLAPEQRDELMALLRAHDDAGRFLSDPTTPVEPSPDDTGPSSFASTARPVEIAGRYRLLKELGEGGFGTVYLAEQQKPVHRQVALKLIKPGMDTRQVVARFEAERQALALMEHENIAQVFDAGATETGRPWFAMERVDGPPLTVYADQHRLSIRQRLELFLQVCRGVRHAHQKGIIHRDLKPANMLVAERDGKPVPKVIDFGIAKALRPKLLDQTATADHLRGVGTLQYMSPEQAAGSADIDTRADVYALGVVLYELLTGLMPHDPRHLREVGDWEAVRIIREVEPKLPSRRLAEADVAAIAPRTDEERRRQVRQVRGELDWIVARAIEKQRDRRYDSVEMLAQDVQRYLANEPLQAAAPSLRYRAGKFVRRNVRPLLAAAAIVFALGVGGSVATAGWLRAKDADARARIEAEKAAAASRVADVEAQQSAFNRKLVSDAYYVFNDILIPLRDETGQERDLAIARLDDVSRRLMTKDMVRVRDEYRAPLEYMLAFNYLFYGMPDKARLHAENSIRVYERLGMGKTEAAGMALVTAGSACAGQKDRESAGHYFNDAIGILTETDRTSSVARAPLAISNLALNLLYTGFDAEARAMVERAIERNRAPNGDPRDEAVILNAFAVGLTKEGRPEEAARYRARIPK